MELELKEVKERLVEFEKEFNPSNTREETVANINFRRRVQRIKTYFKENAVLIDIGGGTDQSNAVLSDLGMDVTVVDLLNSYWQNLLTQSDVTKSVEIMKSHGVKFIEAELITCDLKDFFEKGSADLITSHHCIEHFHHSPKWFLESALDVLKRNGMLVIEVPNAANLRKRLCLLFGYTNYLPYNQFYNVKKYVGHVREYTVGDLKELAENLRLRNVRIFGRNEYGNLYPKIPNILAVPADLMLRKFPGLCGSLFLEGQKN